jgi:hypothetical protein
MREKRRMKVCENRVLRRVFGPKRDEVILEWRKLHNEESSSMVVKQGMLHRIL